MVHDARFEARKRIETASEAGIGEMSQELDSSVVIIKLSSSLLTACIIPGRRAEKRLLMFQGVKSESLAIVTFEGNAMGGNAAQHSDVKNSGR